MSAWHSVANSNASPPFQRNASRQRAQKEKRRTRSPPPRSIQIQCNSMQLVAVRSVVSARAHIHADARAIVSVIIITIAAPGRVVAAVAAQLLAIQPVQIPALALLRTRALDTGNRVRLRQRGNECHDQCGRCRSRPIPFCHCAHCVSPDCSVKQALRCPRILLGTRCRRPCSNQTGGATTHLRIRMTTQHLRKKSGGGVNCPPLLACCNAR